MLTEVDLKRAEKPLGAGATIEITDLRKTYGKATAVDSVSLDVRAGEFMTLLGPSGSGKTTTLNMVAGFVSVDGGQIAVNSHSVEHVPAHRRNIGMVFQNYALFPHMTAAQNVEFPLKQRHVSKELRKARVAAALETVRLGGLGKRFPQELSGGQQQRVALARAIVFSPEVLLMDEPLGALDRNLREEMQAEVRRIHREVGSAVMFVTHDQEEALRFIGQDRGIQ